LPLGFDSSTPVFCGSAHKYAALPLWRPAANVQFFILKISIAQ
jgi:hypothetical protein